MYINEDVLRYFLNDGFKGLEKDKKNIRDRFDRVGKVFEEAKEKEYGDNTILEIINNTETKDKIKNLDNRKHLEIGDARVFTAVGGFNGVVAQAKALCEIKEGEKEKLQQFIKDLLSIMGGFEFSKSDYSIMIAEYRLLSNNSKKYDFHGDTKTGVFSQWISSNFADNTIFVEFCRFIKKCEGQYDSNEIDRTNIALCYPGRVTNININDPYNSGEIKRDYEEQKKILEFRFPYKFMWMWANADNVIHPISLDAFRNFLKSDFMQEIFKELSADNYFNNLEYIWYYRENCDFGGKQTKLEEYPWVIIDCHFDSFPKIWQVVSDKIYSKFFQSDSEKANNLQTLSKVISFLCIGETDMKNISDLLKTHKQIILYGVPGTGKTHSAKKIIKEWQAKSQEESLVEKAKDDEKNELDDYKFSKLLTKEDKNKKYEEEYKNICENKKIIWDIVQFHPNYSYQDFIGGIAPKVDNDCSLSYKLNHGIFKKFCDCAKENKDKKFIFIIDEINRANLSEVFGELLYALEYRDESVSVANFDEFCIPSNVYIIGTMNNVDKSLATFDLALRRRFGFYEVGVDYGVIGGIFSNNKKENDSQEINNNKNIKTNINGYIKRCKELNYLLTNDEKLKQEINVDRLPQILENTQDYYKIGHAYFMKIKNFMDKDEFIINPQHLEKLWIYHIEPLLMEYLGLSYDDSDVKKSIEEIKKHFVKKLDKE